MKSQKDKSEQQSSRQRRDPIWKEGIEKSITRKEKSRREIYQSKGISWPERSSWSLSLAAAAPLFGRSSWSPLTRSSRPCRSWSWLRCLTPSKQKRGQREDSLTAQHGLLPCTERVLSLASVQEDVCSDTGNIQAFHMKQAHHKADFSSSPFRFILFWLVATCKQKVWRKGGGASLLIKMNLLELFL